MEAGLGSLGGLFPHAPVSYTHLTRRLDWKAYARSDRYYIKEFEADTNLRAYIVMDLSGSMNYPPEQVETQYMRACRLAANLACLLYTSRCV